MKAICPSETSANFNKITSRHILHDRNNHLFLMCYMFNKGKALQNNSFAGNILFLKRYTRCC